MAAGSDTPAPGGDHAAARLRQFLEARGRDAVPLGDAARPGEEHGQGDDEPGEPAATDSDPESAGAEGEDGTAQVRDDDEPTSQGLTGPSGRAAP